MITVRHAVKDDLPGILQINNEIIINTTAVYDYEPHTIAMREKWFDAKESEGYPVFVAIENNQVLGFSSIGPFRAWAAYQYSVENSVYVRADCRGNGIGKLLLPPLIDAAVELDKHTIVAGIDAGNEASIRLHQLFGFKEVAHFRQVGFKFDRWLDLKFFQLMLFNQKQ